MWHWSRGMRSERDINERLNRKSRSMSRASRRWREVEWQSVTEWESGKCLPFCMPLKEGIVPGVPLRMPTSKPSPGHHLVAASIDHLQSFIPPIKILSVHITFVFLCWTLLLLHKDTVIKCLWTWCIFKVQKESYIEQIKTFLCFCISHLLSTFGMCLARAETKVKLKFKMFESYYYRDIVWYRCVVTLCCNLWYLPLKQ